MRGDDGRSEVLREVCVVDGRNTYDSAGPAEENKANLANTAAEGWKQTRTHQACTYCVRTGVPRYITVQGRPAEMGQGTLV